MAESMKWPYSEAEKDKLVEMGLKLGFSRKYLIEVRERLWLTGGRLCLQPNLPPRHLCGGPEGLYDPYR